MNVGHGEIRLRMDQCCSVDGCIRPAWKDGVCATCWHAYRWLRDPVDPAENALRWLEAIWSLPATDGRYAA